jgi:hypothetical protein
MNFVKQFSNPVENYVIISIFFGIRQQTLHPTLAKLLSVSLIRQFQVSVSHTESKPKNKQLHQIQQQQFIGQRMTSV